MWVFLCPSIFSLCAFLLFCCSYSSPMRDDLVTVIGYAGTYYLLGRSDEAYVIYLRDAGCVEWTLVTSNGGIGT
ncbi:hypothetical protein K440DRAFT_622917 [Wilcoxina mikolae CBS 423.85]|nr:hypothetical protein K440DRAFT_622917 [Wilcoxina mikolae CBS 423.85]